MVPAGPLEPGIPYPARSWTSGSQDAGPRWRPPRRAGPRRRPSPGRRRRGRRDLRTRPGAAGRGRRPSSRRSAAGTVHGLVGDVSTVGGGRGVRGRGDRGRSAASTSSCPTPAGRPAGGFAGTDLAAYGPALELSLLVDGGDVPGRRARHAGAGLGPRRRDHQRVGPPAHPRADPVEHGPGRRHRLPEDARPRGGRRRRDGELRATRLARHRPAPLAARRRPDRRGRARCPPACSADPRTSVPWWPSSAPTRPASSPARPSPSTAAPTEPSSSRRL